MKLTKTRLKNLILEALEEVEQGLSEISVDYLSRSSDTELEADLQYAKDSCVGLAKSHPKYDEWEEWLSQQELDIRGRPACKTKKELDREKAQKEKHKTADVPRPVEGTYKDFYKLLSKQLGLIPYDKVLKQLKIMPAGWFSSKAKGLGDTKKAAVLLKTLKDLRSPDRVLKSDQTTVIGKMLRRGRFSREELEAIANFLIGKKIVAEGLMGLILESYYSIAGEKHLSIKEVAANWARGEKPYDEDPHDALYSLDELLEYRDFEWAEDGEQKSPEEWNKLLQDVRETGIIEPVVVHVGKNGQAAIAEGNHQLAVAQQVNIRDIPVKFVFLEDEVRKASKMTQEPAEIQVPAEEAHSEKYYIR